MSYTITDYSNKSIGNGLTVDDYTTNTTTILDLVGKGNIDYSNSIFENFIYLLSNFSSPFPPGSNFSTNYQNNNSWLPTLSATASTTMTMDKTVLPGTFWFQTPETNVCSNTITTLIKGYNESKDSTIGATLLSTYDPNNYFTTNQNSVYGQDIDSAGTLWIYVGSTNTSVSPNITTYNGNFMGSYDPTELGWEAYSTITVSTSEPANRYAIWLNMNDNNFYFYDSSKAMWARIGTPSSIEPTEESTGVKIADGTLRIKDGQLWMKDSSLTSNNTSYPPLYQTNVDSSVISNGWVLVGPESPTPDKQVNGISTGFDGTISRYAVLIDTSGSYHDNTLIFIGGTLIAIVSKDKFTINATTPVLGGDNPTPSITGFEVYPGINLVSSSFYFNGSITDGGVDYATKQYVDEAITGGTLGYTPVQQGGGTGMNTTHIFMGQSTDGNDIYIQAGSQQYGAIAFESWTGSNFLSLTNGGVVKGATSFNAGATAVTTSINDNSTNIATTAFVNNLLKNSYINKSGDTATGKINFNGGATSVTPASGDNSTNIATTAFLNTALGSYVPTKPSSGQVACTGLVYSTTQGAPYFTSSSWSGRLLTSSDNLSYLPTSSSTAGSLINSRVDNTYNLPSFESSNGVWHTVPDINYLSSFLGNYINKTGDTATGKINFNGGATSTTPAAGDNSTNVATTAFLKNNYIPYENGNWTGNLTAVGGSGSSSTQGVINYSSYLTYILTNRNSAYTSNFWLEEEVGVEARQVINVNGYGTQYFFQFSDTGAIRANIFNGTATQSQFADLAENYKTDKNYEPGTLVMIGGEKEITELTNKNNYFGVISSNPGLLLNSECDDSLPVALVGRVPVKIIGSIKKGDKISINNKGQACKKKWYNKNVIGIALEDNDNDNIKLVECFVGRTNV